jgi:hypothetical protein
VELEEDSIGVRSGVRFAAAIGRPPGCRQLRECALGGSRRKSKRCSRPRKPDRPKPVLVLGDHDFRLAAGLGFVRSASSPLERLTPVMRLG